MTDLKQVYPMNREDIIRNVYGKDLGNLITKYAWNGNVSVDMLNKIDEGYDRDESFESQTFLAKVCRRASRDPDFYLAVRFFLANENELRVGRVADFYIGEDFDFEIKNEDENYPFIPSVGFSLDLLSYCFEGCYNSLKDHFEDQTGFDLREVEETKHYAKFFVFDDDFWTEACEEDGYVFQERYENFYIWNFGLIEDYLEDNPTFMKLYGISF